MVHCGAPRLRLADGQPLLLRGRAPTRPSEEPPRGLVAPGRRAARQRILGAPQLGRELRGREPPHHRARASARRRSEVFGADVDVYYEISHNLVQEETLVLPDGTTKRGFVHRKGATRAFPAGHPDLVGTRVGGHGAPVPHPGLDVRGRGHPLSRCAGRPRAPARVNHGSGRLLARGEAKRRLEHEQDSHRRRDGAREAHVRGHPDRGHRRQPPARPARRVRPRLQGPRRRPRGARGREASRASRSRLYPVANIKGAD